MNLTPDTVIIAIPGEAESREIPLQAARDAIARGEIEQTFWAWSVPHQDWKPVSEIPELQAPVVLAAAPATRLVNARATRSLVVKEEAHFSFFKLFVILLFLAVVGGAAGNYLYVDQPLTTKMAQSSFATVPVHAHLGAFIQPDAVVIHILPTTEIRGENMAGFLATLAGNTPPQPLNQQAFHTVGLTSLWVSQYIITGSDWQALGQMAKASDEEKRDFLLSHLAYTTGEPVMKAKAQTDPDVIAQYKSKVWEEILTTLFPSR